MEVLQRTANRGSVSTGPYQISNSVKMEADNTEYLNRVIASGGNRKTWTISAWVKRTEISDASHGGGHTIFGVNVSGNEGCLLRFNTGTTAATLDTIQIDIGAGGTLSRSHTTRKFKDTSAWYHIVLAVDTTQGTATDRFKLYVNGELETSYYSRNNPAQNFDTSNNQADNSCTQHIGAYTSSGTAYGKFCGYIAEVNHVDGAALAPTEFGEVDSGSGIWIPIEASPTYGTNGFFLDFADSGNLGDDESGNGLDFTEVNIAAADQATDTPTNNFCTWNVVAYYNTGYFFENGATEVVRGTGTGWTTAYSSMGANKGKWYAEFQVLTSGNYLMNGQVPLSKIESVYGTQFYLGSDGSAAAGAGYYSSGTSGNDAIYHDGGYTGSGVTTSAGDIISVAMDCDNNKVHFAVNGSYTNSSDPANNTNGFTMTDDYQFFAHSSLTGNQVFKNNFGGYTTMSISSAASDANGHGTFEYAPPSGYFALCTKNLAEKG